MRIECPACGGNGIVQPDDRIIRCDYCDSMLLVELGDALVKKTFKITIPADLLQDIVHKALKEHELTGNVSVVRSNLEYVPFWKFTTGTVTCYQPAATMEESFWERYTPESGELKYFDPAEIRDAAVIDPDIYLDVAVSNLTDSRITGNPDMVPSLVFVPFYRVEFQYGSTDITALVSGHTGLVFFDNIPASPALILNHSLVITASIVFVSYTFVTFTLAWLARSIGMVFLGNAVLSIFLYKMLLKMVKRR